MFKPIIPFLFISIACLTSCSDSTKDKEESIRPLPTDQQPAVTTVTLTRRPFERELISNGRIATKTIAELRFINSEIISKVFVKNGTRVKRGDTIATLNNYVARQSLEQAKDVWDRTELEYRDVLIGQGYKANHKGAIPEEIEKLARVKSGYNAAEIQYNISKHQLKQTVLVAPIAGVVANLFAKSGTVSSPSGVFCNVIDFKNLEVTFTILESELDLVGIGNRVTINPYSISSLTVDGNISEVNPWVDDKGMVKIKASVSYHAKLVEGMNVRVHIFRSMGNQLVLPRSAVVIRNGKQVVFSLVNNKAYWHYVKTVQENADSYVIMSETLKQGDLIIVSGNNDLAHETSVIVANPAKDSK